MLEQRVATTLFYTRLSVFLVMLMWTLDKFVNPGHAARVYEHFYFISGLGETLVYLIGAAELLVLAAFVAGIAKRWTYGAVLLFHAVSTLSSFQMYITPWEKYHLLFFAAWPMLAACFALFYLRNYDTRWTLTQ